MMVLIYNKKTRQGYDTCCSLFYTITKIQDGRVRKIHRGNCLTSLNEHYATVSIFLAVLINTHKSFKLYSPFIECLWSRIFKHNYSTTNCTRIDTWCRIHESSLDHIYRRHYDSSYKTSTESWYKVTRHTCKWQINQMTLTEKWVATIRLYSKVVN